MDLVSHDMLNDNQAVLSYLELILAIPGLDSKAADYARKAVSHVRSSTMRIENVKTIVTARKASVAALGSADLMVAIKESCEDLPRIFPSKIIRIESPTLSGKAMVVGGGLVRELLVTVMASIVKLDPEREARLKLKVAEDDAYGAHGWTVTIEDPNVKLPAMVKDTDMDLMHTKDSSLAAKVSGLLFAKMAAEALNGDFDIQQGGAGDASRGAVFVLKLRRAGTR